MAEGELTEGVSGVLERRIGRLGDDAVRLLRLAAVSGADFGLETVRRVSELPDDRVAELLEEALAEGLVTELDAGEDRFRFSHGLIRDALLGGMSRARRVRVHARIGEALAAIREEGGAAPLALVAHHLLAARGATDRIRAVELAVAAADEALRKAAYAEALDLMARALAAVPEDDPRRFRLAAKRALAYQALGHARLDAPARVDEAERGVRS